MRFDLSTDLTPESELPDDLQMLAEQLGEDALHLSALYPAQNSDKWAQTASAETTSHDAKGSGPPAQPAAVSAKLKRGMKWAAVAASLFIAAGVSWNFRPPAEFATPPNPSLPAPQEPVAKQRPKVHELQPEETLVIHTVNNQTVSAETFRVEGTPATEPVTVSTGLFMTLSSSEQEALLDLIEDENLPQPSVSF